MIKLKNIILKFELDKNIVTGDVGKVFVILNDEVIYEDKVYAKVKQKKEGVLSQ